MFILLELIHKSIHAFNNTMFTISILYILYIVITLYTDGPVFEFKVSPDIHVHVHSKIAKCTVYLTNISKL